MAFTHGKEINYVEKHQVFTAGADASWQTKDLSGYGVPANALCEILIVSKAAGNEREGGVRAVGSSLARKISLHEAEGGGVTAVTMLVKADDSSQIQVYAEVNTDIDFYLIGYFG